MLRSKYGFLHEHIIAGYARDRLTGRYCPCLYTLLLGLGLLWSKVMDKSAELTTRVRHLVKAFFKIFSTLKVSANTPSSFLPGTIELDSAQEYAPVRVRYLQMMLTSSVAEARRCCQRASGFM